MKIRKYLLHKCAAATVTAIAASSLSALAQDKTETKRPGKSDAANTTTADECEDILKSSGKIIGEVHSEIAQIRLVVDSIGNLQARVESLKETSDKHKLEAAALRKECEAHKKALADSAEKHANEIAALKQKHEQSQTVATALVEEAEVLNAQLAEARQTAEEQVKANESLKLEKTAAATQLTAILQQVKDQKAKATEKMNQQISTLAAQLAEKDKQFKELSAKLKASADQSAELATAVETAEVKAKKAKTETCDIVKRLAEARSELATLNQKLQKLAAVEIPSGSPTEKSNKKE